MTSTTPGPGTYTPDLKNGRGEILSTHINSTVPKLALPIRKEGYERVTHEKPQKGIPPPGSYDLPDKKLTEIRLYLRPRKLVTHDKTSAMDGPPPGSYRPPSDFGHLPTRQ